jgi:hypothetical protein
MTTNTKGKQVALIEIKLDDRTYEIDPDKITLGEARVLKRDYGMESLGSLNFGDPDQMVGMLVMAIRRESPDLSEADVQAKVEDLDFVQILDGMKLPGETKDPPSAGGKDTSPARKPSGPATTRKKPGKQS